MIASCRFSQGICLMVNFQAKEKVKGRLVGMTSTNHCSHRVFFPALVGVLSSPPLSFLPPLHLPEPHVSYQTLMVPNPLLPAFPPLVLFLVLNNHCLDYWPVSLLIWTRLPVWTLPAGMNSTWSNIRASPLSILQTITCKESPNQVLICGIYVVMSKPSLTGRFVSILGLKTTEWNEWMNVARQ